MSAPLAVLVGPPGSGKTQAGRALARLLGVTFLDTDEAVEQTAGRSVADIFVDDGETVFRELERAAVASALAEERGVVSLGGGAVLDAGTRSRLEGLAVVFLDVGIADASRRIGFDRSRPLLGINPRASWIALMNERRPTYEGVGTVRVDTAGRTPEEVAETVAAALALTGPRRGA
ncbi:MAG: shikimate kinase [Lapillicoccus sp.]